MILLNAREFGMFPGCEITGKLAELLTYASTLKGDKIITFDIILTVRSV